MPESFPSILVFPQPHWGFAERENSSVSYAYKGRLGCWQTSTGEDRESSKIWEEEGETIQVFFEQGARLDQQFTLGGQTVFLMSLRKANSPRGAFGYLLAITFVLAKWTEFALWVFISMPRVESCRYHLLTLCKQNIIDSRRNPSERQHLGIKVAEPSI